MPTIRHEPRFTGQQPTLGNTSEQSSLNDEGNTTLENESDRHLWVLGAKSDAHHHTLNAKIDTLNTLLLAVVLTNGFSLAALIALIVRLMP